MSALTATAGLGRPGRALAFVWKSWRSVQPAYFRLALWTGVLLGFSQGIGSSINARGPWWANFFGMSLPLLAQALLLLAGFAVAVNVTTNRLPQWLPFALAATIATLVAAAIDWAGGYVIARIGGLPWEFEAIEVLGYATGQLPTMLLIGFLAAFGCTYFIDAQRRTERLRSLQLERVRVTRRAYEARLQALQARVEPRFLFETLSAAETLYETAPETAACMLDNLISYLRAALPALEDSSSTLRAELTLVQTWLDIARIRSGDRLCFALPEDQGHCDARMPPMLLVPLVQHAVEHGGAGTGAVESVFVSASVVETRLRIVVTGPAAAFAPASETPAITAIRERLRALYGTAAELTTEAVEHALSRATLEIPYERTDRGPR